MQQLLYIDEQAKLFLRNLGDDQYGLINYDPTEIHEVFQDAVEAAAFGAPASIFPDHYPGNDDDYTDDQMEANCQQEKLIADLIWARLFQLIKAPTLTS